MFAHHHRYRIEPPVTVNETPGPRLRLLISGSCPTNFWALYRSETSRACCRARGARYSKRPLRVSESWAGNLKRAPPAALLCLNRETCPPVAQLSRQYRKETAGRPPAAARSGRPTLSRLACPPSGHRAVPAGAVTDAPAHGPRSRAVGATCRLNRMIIRSPGGDGSVARPRRKAWL